MDFEENGLDKECTGLQAINIFNEFMDPYAVYCRPKALTRDGPTSLIVQITSIVVAQKLRFLEDFGFK